MALVVRVPGNGGAQPWVSSSAWAQVPAAPVRPPFFPFEQGLGAPASVLMGTGGARRCSVSRVAAILLSACRSGRFSARDLSNRHGRAKVVLANPNPYLLLFFARVSALFF